MPGTKIEYGGETVTVGAVGITGGERYYWLTYEDGAVLMVPAFMVEEDDCPRYVLTRPGRAMLKGGE